MNRECILEQAKQHDSFYLYEEAIIRKNTEQLKTDFPGVTFLYSVKCNPYPEVLRCVLNQGFGVDAASLAECVMGQKAGLGKDMVIFSAPGKTMADIRGGLGISTLVADSAAEVERIQEAAAEQGVVAEIGLRVNPDFTYTADTGVASKFGIDEQLIYDSMEAWKKLPNIRIVGLHAHLKSQELSAETLKGYYRNMFRLSVSMREAFGTLKFVNLGSGMGIPFCETDKPFDTTALGAETQRLMAEFQEKLPETRFYIETGRYAVGTAGTYVAKVVDKKVTHGKNFVLLSATLTVRAHEAASHQGHGWETFTDAVIAHLAATREHLVFLLWGAYAIKKGAFIDRSRHLVLTSPHPSPLSAHRGFFGNHHFSQANAYLTQHGETPINW